MTSTAALAALIDDLTERVDVLFPVEKRTSVGDMGQSLHRCLSIANHHHRRFSWPDAAAIVEVVGELVGVMEQREREFQEMDAYYNEVYESEVAE